VKLAAAAAVVFVGAIGYLFVAPYDVDLDGDIPVYYGVAEQVHEGRTPYREFRFEYPPGALPAVLVPSIRHRGDPVWYRRAFRTLMSGFGVVLVGLTAVCLRRLDADRAWAIRGLGLIAIAPLLLGATLVTRFDLWPAGLTGAAVAALLFGRHRLAAVGLGLAAATKAYPAVLVPLVLGYVWRTRGPRAAVGCAAAFLGALGVVVIPFVALSPGGVWDSVTYQTSRPLQVESLGAAVLLAAHHVLGVSLTSRAGHGSQNLVGSLPDAVAAVQSVVTVVSIAGLWLAFARGPASRDRLLRYSAAALVVVVAFDKVLSPQFLIWLLPLVPLVGGRRGLVASGLLASAMVLTQLWFPGRYWDLALHFDATASWLVLARDLVLVGLLAVLAAPGLRTAHR
jgi:hypothetical protein